MRQRGKEREWWEEDELEMEMEITSSADTP
jgi:hypothetical protein